MEAKSESGRSQQDKTSPNSPTIKYLKEKSPVSSFRKNSTDSQIDRHNFCFNFNSSQYSGVRSYINAESQQQVGLYYTKFTPRNKIGQICIIHGYGESTDDYLTMAQFFAKRGYVINMLDLRGFGYSGGSRVNEPTHKVLGDIERLMKQCCEKNLPTFIVCHGLGSLFINALLQQNRDLSISGVINITPLVNFVSAKRSSTLQRLLLLISPLLNNVLVHAMINPTALAKDPNAIKAMVDSNFWQFFITLKMADQYERLGQKIRSEGHKFTYPTLFFCGQKDQIQQLSQIQTYFHSLGSPDKQMFIFREGYHQLHMDYQADQLMLRMLEWMQERKGKCKWKQPKKIVTESVLGKRLWLRKVLKIVMVLIGLLFAVRKVINMLPRGCKF